MLSKQKQLSLVFATKVCPKEGVRRAEIYEAKAYDYPTAAEYNSPLLRCGYIHKQIKLLREYT